ncbi:PASTA domain-containing protein [Catenuloplanes atrovinosus]|uniref:PASTA domain-containing protein n=1 Tax=Catenuloplanes atrovinosus TaxID=137266 RepID=A0AAE3YIE4_9ACTN|nr:PASTA domain-containing protein [Catenuloplanes atrovinosus]MDR7274055.1 hypothetical protein [Catenuloplanes atrovinosus]
MTQSTTPGEDARSDEAGAETVTLPPAPERTPAEAARRGATEPARRDGTEGERRGGAEAGPDGEDEPAQRVRLHTRILRRFEGQVQLPGGLVLNGAGKVGLVFVLLFAAVAGTVFAMRWEPTAKVPALVGLTRADAEARLADADLVVGGIEFEDSAEPPGTVLRTDPRIGTKMAHDSGVTLVLARAAAGPQVIVPSLPPGTPQPGSAVAPGGDVNVVVPGPGAPVPAPPNPGPNANPGNPANPNNPGPPRPAPGGTTQQPPPPPPATVTMLAGEAVPDPDADNCTTGYRTIFRQTVAMSGPGRVTLRWLRSDGALGPVETVDFTAAGTRTFETTWLRTGAPGDTLGGWQQLDVSAPNAARGAQLTFTHTCPGESPG